MDRRVRQAVIMVGGKGTRLRPLTNTCPKPILPVLDKPCLMYLIESFVRGGIEDIILACGYKSEMMASAIGDGSDLGIEIEYSYEDVPMGTGGAIKMLEGRLDDVFVAANGDVFADMDLRAQIDAHFSKGADITISLASVDNPWNFGMAIVDDDMRITSFKEKSKPEEAPSNLINSGIYVVNKEMLRYIPEGEMYDFSKQLFNTVMERGHSIFGRNIDGVWMDVGRPSDLIGANLLMAERTHMDWHSRSSNVESRGVLFIGQDSFVSDSTIDSAVVMRDCFVKDSELHSSVVMQGCDLNGAVVRDSIIGKGCIVRPNVRIIDSVVGDDSIVDADIIGQRGGE